MDSSSNPSTYPSNPGATYDPNKDSDPADNDPWIVGPDSISDVTANTDLEAFCNPINGCRGTPIDLISVYNTISGPNKVPVGDTSTFSLKAGQPEDFGTAQCDGCTIVIAANPRGLVIRQIPGSVGNTKTLSSPSLYLNYVEKLDQTVKGSVDFGMVGEQAFIFQQGSRSAIGGAGASKSNWLTLKSMRTMSRWCLTSGSRTMPARENRNS